MTKEFVFDWVKRIGFRKNPFDTSVPVKLDRFFTGYEKEKQKVNLFILERYKFGTVSGEEGIGKTNLLRWIEKKLSSHKDKVKVAYIDSGTLNTERNLIEALTLPLLNIYEKNVAKVHKKLMLEDIGRFLYSKLKEKTSLLILLDDVHKLPKRYISLFKYLFNQKMKVQLIVAGTKQAIHESGITNISEKDNLHIDLEGLNYEECLWLLEKRVGAQGRSGIFPFEKHMLKPLFEKSGENPKKFLVECREKAIKLSLDEKYMKKQFMKLEEERRKKVEEIEEEGDKKVISIKFGKSKYVPESSQNFETLKAPDLKEQSEMLANLVGHEKVAEKIAVPKDFTESKDEGSKKEHPGGDHKKEEHHKKTKDMDETDKFLAKLAEEFEES